ncbi:MULTISPECIES: NAD(P)/FAD-dependent oxidoreductase [Rhodomicrobium]|uniref:NAD(P)/FAD-dependent oxidoreductase n=1 Tax=Rhodomicrobium TaxID=1068 RepID=UPI000B4BD12D|nr:MULTISPECIES: NAD(P)/FAD-dependent oxidoreductase [Rhodomicrobium]
MSATRRDFLKGTAMLGAGLATARLATPALAQAKPKVVIIGGGPGGLIVLRELVNAGANAFDITLVEAQRQYTTCFYSNLYLGGFQRIETLTFDYGIVAKLPGVTVAHDLAATVDRQRREVVLQGGARLPYDRLVMAPGIDLDYGSVPGWSAAAEERMPHAWKGGAQTRLLKSQIEAVPDGGLIVMIAPPAPYRCPPGPYERASMMAWALKTAGKSKARIVILDPKERFSKQGLFQAGWEKYYPGVIEWLPQSIHGGVQSVDPATMTVVTGFETYAGAALVNVIPRQTAGRIAREAGLTNGDNYCPIDAFTMASRMDPAVFVVGDACIPGDMPKSAFSAASQARAAASVIRAELTGGAKPALEFANTCWSLIAADDSVKIGGAYAPSEAKITERSAFLSKPDESAEVRRDTYAESAAWYGELTAAMFL